MKLFDILKQFKNIEPDARFTAHSKAEILISPRAEKRTIGIFTFLHVLETSAAVVLAGFFILVLTGSFSGAHSIAPIQYAVIDPAGLHAEAQAIDMQIQLANVDYAQTTSTGDVTSSSTIATGTAMKFAVIKPSTISAATSTNIQDAGATSTSSSSVSVDAALKQLSQ